LSGGLSDSGIAPGSGPQDSGTDGGAARAVSAQQPRSAEQNERPDARAVRARGGELAVGRGIMAGPLEHAGAMVVKPRSEPVSVEGRRNTEGEAPW